jgi:hypothetical protein
VFLASDAELHAALAEAVTGDTLPLNVLLQFPEHLPPAAPAPTAAPATPAAPGATVADVERLLAAAIPQMATAVAAVVSVAATATDPSASLQIKRLPREPFLFLVFVFRWQQCAANPTGELHDTV